jgi:tetratricopeptide (TPR) repeat protein
MADSLPGSRAATAHPKSETSEWFELGCELQKAERYQEAVSAFGQALEIDPKLPFLRNKLAWVYWQLKNYSTALALYETLVSESASDFQALIGVSISARSLRLWDKSLSAAKRAF